MANSTKTETRPTPSTMAAMLSNISARKTAELKSALDALRSEDTK